MAFVYAPPPSDGELRQGEILTGLYELQPRRSPTATIEDEEIPVEPIIHPRVMIMTADCDLLQDFSARTSYEDRIGDTGIEQEISNMLPSVLLCDLYIQEELRSRVPKGSEIWRRIEQNQNERYQHLISAPIVNSDSDRLPDLYMDFKKLITIPPYWLYKGLERPDTYKLKREAVVPVIYLQQVMHRFFGFQSRIGTPD